MARCRMTLDLTSRMYGRLLKTIITPCLTKLNQIPVMVKLNRMWTWWRSYRITRRKKLLFIATLLISIVIIAHKVMPKLCRLTLNNVKVIQIDIFKGDSGVFIFEKDDQDMKRYPNHLRYNEYKSDVKAYSSNKNTNHSTIAPVLTLFTTMKGTEDRDVIHINTLRNWGAMRPHVTPILFNDGDTKPDILLKAVQYGWEIRRVPKILQGIPILKYMFLDVMETYETRFYGYANGDIIFDDSLLENINYHMAVGTSPFLVGRRTNVNVTDIANVNITNSRHVYRLAKNYGQVFTSDAQDYFITTRHGFPWIRIPDLVIGRPGYDNWLVVMAGRWGQMVVDCSYTLLAIHQTGQDGNKSGWSNSNKANRCINREIVGKFNYSQGHTECIKYVSYRDIRHNVNVIMRPNVDELCTLYQPTMAVMGCV